MKISLVINTSNQPVALRQVLDSVFAQSRPPDEILVADDGSGDETRRLIDDARRRGGVPLSHHWQEKAGFRKSRILNRCIAAAGDYIVFLDGDCVPHRHFIKDHAALAERGFWVQGRRVFVKEAFVHGFMPSPSKVLLYAICGRLSGPAKAFRYPFPIVRKNTDMKGILGCNQGIWRDDLLAINGYDEAFEGWGREDSDLGARLYHLGRKRKLVHGRMLLFHLNHPPAARDHLQNNDALLAATLLNKTVRCKRGLVHEETI
jgi:glycosyltransferase involved in cell wall biosynthesis